MAGPPQVSEQRGIVLLSCGPFHIHKLVQDDGMHSNPSVADGDGYERI